MHTPDLITLVVGLIAAATSFASQRSASRVAKHRTDEETKAGREVSRLDAEKEAYERARRFDLETIDRLDEENDDLRAENKDLKGQIRVLEARLSERKNK